MTHTPRPKVAFSGDQGGAPWVTLVVSALPTASMVRVLLTGANTAYLVTGRGRPDDGPPFYVPPIDINRIPIAIEAELHREGGRTWGRRAINGSYGHLSVKRTDKMFKEDASHAAWDKARIIVDEVIAWLASDEAQPHLKAAEVAELTRAVERAEAKVARLSEEYHAAVNEATGG